MKRNYRFLNQSLILGVDAHDNGKAPQLRDFALFSNIVSNFNPIEYEASKPAQDLAFRDAMHFVVGHLQRLLQRINTCNLAVKRLRECMRRA